jgi:hypothetical protein
MSRLGSYNRSLLEVEGLILLCRARRLVPHECGKGAVLG